MNKDLYYEYIQSLKKEFSFTNTAKLLHFLKEQQKNFLNHPYIEKIQYVLEYDRVQNKNKQTKWREKNQSLSKERMIHSTIKSYLKTISKEKMLKWIDFYNEHQTTEEGKIIIDENTVKYSRIQ